MKRFRIEYYIKSRRVAVVDAETQEEALDSIAGSEPVTERVIDEEFDHELRIEEIGQRD